MSHVEGDTHATELGQERPEFSADKGFEGVAMCAEAQADGVPCTELGRRCEECERVARAADPDAW